MMRKLIVLLAVIAALWGIPATRERIGAAAVPLLEKLGPAGAWALRPAYRYSARHDLDALLDDMRQGMVEGRRPPEPREFPGYARRKLESDALDPWGNGYWMQRKGKTVTLGSSGPDGEKGTLDDITKTAAF